MTSPGVRSSQPLRALTLEAGVEPVQAPAATGVLLEQLALALDREGIRYCQWKGHWSAHRWSRGYGAVDLLVDHGALTRFRTLAGQLGFKLASPAAERQIPGVEHYFGFDPMVPRLLRLHVHYRLLVGEYWKRVYRLPLEHQIFQQSVPGQPFRVPSPTHTFLIFVFRMMLRQVGRPLLSAQARWLSGIQVPLASLEAASDTQELTRVLDQHLFPIDLRFFKRCVRSLMGQSGRGDRLMLPWQLHLRLGSHMRRPSVRSLVSAALERILPLSLTALLGNDRLRLSGGGLVIALNGADGAGKSTCARELHHWLAPEFPTMRAHLGNPPKSLLTVLVLGAHKFQQSLARRLRRSPHPGGLLEVLRHFCTARDNYRLYRRVHRFAVAGGIALCERYPVRPDSLDLTPYIPALLSRDSGWLANQLGQLEASYYSRMLPPDALFVLKLDPELAVLRKPGEPADQVRARARAILNLDWSTSPAHLVDAGRPLPDVLRQLKTMIWSIL